MVYIDIKSTINSTDKWYVYIYCPFISTICIMIYHDIHIIIIHIYIFINTYQCYKSIIQVNPSTHQFFPDIRAAPGILNQYITTREEKKKQHQKCVISKFELFLLNVPVFLVDIEAFCYAKNRSQKFFATPGWSASPHWIWSCWACPTGLPSGKETVGPWK